MATSFQGIEACVFDAYGTLFDIRSVTDACSKELGEKADPLSELWRRKQLEYTWLRSLMGAYEDFWHITGESLDYAMAAFGLADPGVRARLMQAYLSIKTYSETPGVLASLKDQDLKTAILSNGSPSMLTSAVTNAALRDSLDETLSVEEVQTFKPHPSVYQFAADRLRVDIDKVLFFSSNCWDALGAKMFGFNVVWVNRFNQPLDNLSAEPDLKLVTLAPVPGLVNP